MGCPWWDTTNRSTVPRRFTGHIRSNSLMTVRSPRCTVRNLPKVMYLARGSHNAHIQARDRNLVAGFYDRVLGLAVKPRIDLLDKIIGCLSRLNVRTVVNELANRNAAREFFHASEMVAVPVRRDEVIDL